VTKTRECSQCGAQRPYPDGFHRDASKPGGRRPDCKDCARARVRRHHARNGERVRASARRSYRESPEIRQRKNETTRRTKIKRLYGLTVEEYDAIIARGCAICGATEGVHLDHDHTTGAIRDALCGPCNRAIGLVKDDAARLHAAADYLDAHREG
jgi:hypothetical protein